MRPDGMGQFVRVTARERATATTVTVRVDEAGHDQRALDVDMVARGRCTGSDVGDHATGDRDPAVVKYAVRRGYPATRDHKICCGTLHAPQHILVWTKHGDTT
jgi:hypothetical protein